MSSFNDFEEFDFDAEQVDPSSSFDPMPPGKYPAVVREAEVLDAKTGSGKRLSLKFEIFQEGGEYDGRMVFANLNIRNQSAKAEEIGKRQLSAFCRAVGVMQPKASSEFLDKPLVIKLKIVPPQNGYDAKNEVADFLPYGADVAESAPAKPAAPAAAPAKPWERKPK